MKQLRLRKAHEAAGATFQQDGDWEVPRHYGNPTEEVRVLKQGAGVLDLSEFESFQVSGRDRIRFLNSMLSNEISRLVAGQGAYATLLSIQGRMVADFRVLTFENHVVLLSSRDTTSAGIGMLDRYLIADKVTFSSQKDSHAWISLQGPEAAQVLKTAFPELSRPSSEYHHEALPESAGGGFVVASDRSGFGGFDLAIPIDSLESVWTLLLASGGLPMGRQALEIARVERGIPLPGKDLEDRIPLEAGEAFEAAAISHHKGCYIGQEVVCRIKSRGHVNWLLTAFTLAEGGEAGDRLFSPQKDVGWLSTVVDSPDLGRIGLGFVHRMARKMDSSLAIGALEGTHKAVIHEIPLVSPPATD